jgi:hypothetical protein
VGDDRPEARAEAKREDRELKREPVAFGAPLSRRLATRYPSGVATHAARTAWPPAARIRGFVVPLLPDFGTGTSETGL